MWISFETTIYSASLRRKYMKILDLTLTWNIFNFQQFVQRKQFVSQETAQ